MSVLFECTCSQTILKTDIISYYILHFICMETKRKTAYLCFLYFREWRDPIQNRRRKLSFTSLIEACFKFKFKYPSSLNPRFTTILHLCAIEVVRSFMGSPAVHISLAFYKIALFQITNGANSRFYLSKTSKKYHTFLSFQNGRQKVTPAQKPLIKSAASSRFQFP